MNTDGINNIDDNKKDNDAAEAPVNKEDRGNTESNINLEKRDAETPPPVKREFEVEEEWAEKLGMHFDADRVKETTRQTPPPMPPANHWSQGPAYPGGPGQATPDANIPPLRQPMPPTYLVWSIIATLCCCMPAGVVAIIFSASVSSKYYAADYDGARKASRKAEIWIIVSIVAGIVTNALYLPLTLLLPS